MDDHETESMRIPWMIMEPHREQAATNHGGETLERLAERGGLLPREALCAIRGLPLSHVTTMTREEGFLQLEKYVNDKILDAVFTEIV